MGACGNIFILLTYNAKIYKHQACAQSAPARVVCHVWAIKRYFQLFYSIIWSVVSIQGLRGVYQAVHTPFASGSVFVCETNENLGY